MLIYYFAVLLASLSLGSSLRRTNNELPDEERYSFFDTELLQVYNHKESGNFLISPISVKLILGMILEGAKGRTAEEIRMALRLPENEEEKRKEFQTWLSLLKEKGSQNTFKIGNQIFLSNKFQINTDFENILKKYYSGGVTNVKFEHRKETSQLINSWVSNQTSLVLTNILEEDQIDSENDLIFISAIYFKGLWSSRFASEKSAVRCFYSKRNQCKDVRMMTKTGYFDYGYVSRLDAKAIVLPYQGDKFSMLFLLPTKIDGIEQLGRDLIHVSLKSILSEVDQEEVFLQIPQFEITYNDDLVESLKKVHICRMFNQNANLSRILFNNTEKSIVSSIRQSAKLTVSEDGSEAAGATAALFIPLMGGPTTSFIANHPFIFFLFDRSKYLVIFAGKVVLPVAPVDHKDTSRDNSDQLSTFSDNKENFAGLPMTVFKVEKNQTRRGQETKVRSIKPAFTVLRAPTNKKITNDESQSMSTFYKIFVPRPTPFIEPLQKSNKAGKAAQVTPKKPKRQEVQNDDWRHHVLFFT